MGASLADSYLLVQYAALEFVISSKYGMLLHDAGQLGVCRPLWR